MNERIKWSDAEEENLSASDYAYVILGTTLPGYCGSCVDSILC